MRNSTGRWLLLRSLVVAATLPMASPAAATETPATDRVKEGVALFEEEEYPGALAAFEAAYRRAPKTSLLFNIAMCQKALFMYVESIETFEKYLAEMGEHIRPARKAEVTALVDEMREEAARISISGPPEGSVVYINGREVAHVPLASPLLVNPGHLVVEVKKEGYQPFRTELAAGQAKEVTLSVALERLKTVLIVECRERDAVVSLDGAEVGTCPYEGEVTPGHHELLIAAPGKESVARIINAPQTGVFTVSVDLPPVVAPKSVSTRAEPVVPKEGDSADGAPSNRKVRVLTVVGSTLVGVGLVAGVVGAVFTSRYFDNRNQAQDAKDRYEHPPADYTADDAAADRITFDSRMEALPKNKAGMAAGYVAAGLLLAAGTAVLIVDARKQRRAAPPIAYRLTPNSLEITF